MKKWIWRVSSIILIVMLLFSAIGSPIVQNKVSTFSAGFIKDVLTVGLSNVAYAAATPDYVCDGVDDNVQVQAALDDLPSTGGKLVIYGGNYSFSATVSRPINNITFEGSGKSTYLTYNASTPLISAGSQTGWVFRDIRTDAGWLTLAGDTVVVDCWNAGALTYVGGDSHSNRNILDTITEAFTTALKASYDAAVTNSHTHSNKSTLDAITESFTTALKASYDWLVTNITSAWKATVDNFVSSKGQASGLAPLDATSKVPTVNLGGSGASSSNYLRGDQTWATPSGGSNPLTSIVLTDEFIGGLLTTGNAGSLGWGLTTAPTVVASVANHVGIRQIPTSTTSGNVNAFWLGAQNTDNIQYNDLCDFTFVIRITDISTMTAFVGAMDAMTTAVGNQDRYGFEYIAGTDTYWRMVTGNGSASTRTNTDITVVNNTWYTLRVVRTGSGVDYYINGVSKGSITTNLPDTALNFGFHVQTNTAALRSMQCDFFNLVLTVTR